MRIRLYVMLDGSNQSLLSSYFATGPEIGLGDDFLTIRAINFMETELWDREVPGCWTIMKTCQGNLVILPHPLRTFLKSVKKLLVTDFRFVRMPLAIGQIMKY
jgi:hypothetical protein